MDGQEIEVDGDQLSLMLTSDDRPDSIDPDSIYFTIPFTLSGDYCGGTVELANRRYIEEHWDISEHYEGYYAHSSRVTLSDLDRILHEDNDGDDIDAYCLIDFMESIVALSHYPVFDDESISAVENELLDEHIQENMIQEITWKLSDLDCDADRDYDDLDCLEHMWDDLSNDDQTAMIQKAIWGNEIEVIYEYTSVYIDDDKEKAIMRDIVKALIAHIAQTPA